MCENQDFSFPSQRMRIVIAGGSGQIGRSLAAHFQYSGHRVAVLTRAPYAANWPTIYWDGEYENLHQGGWIEAIASSDLLINLSGHSIACPLTEKNRQAIRDSRLRSTELLNRVLARLETPPKLWMNASAARIAGLTPEKSARGASRFFSRLTEEWETLFFSSSTPATRKIALRNGLFLAPAAGNLFVLLSRLARAGLGGTLGNGRQTLSWIHATDYARAIEFLAAREDLDGVFNLTAPEPLPNRDFMAVLRDAWDRPNGVPCPTPLLYLIGLLRADARLALDSSHAVPDRLLRAGFAFEFPDWPSAAMDLARQWRERDFSSL